METVGTPVLWAGFIAFVLGGHGVGPKQDLVLIDTNIFVIDLEYKRDTNYEVNRVFLDYINDKGNGFTTIVNLLELCGILSFNLNEETIN